MKHKNRRESLSQKLKRNKPLIKLSSVISNNLENIFLLFGYQPKSSFHRMFSDIEVSNVHSCVAVNNTTTVLILEAKNQGLTLFAIG